MIEIHEHDVISVFNYFKKKAINAFYKGSLNDSLKFIELCCKIAYNFNFFYKDQELEDLICAISLRFRINECNKRKRKVRRYVLIDTNGSDNHGLTQQYIRAFIAAGIEFAYIYEDTDLSRISLILKELEAYPKATVFTFKEKVTFEEQIVKIYLFLLDYSPTKYFMHIMPWDVVAVAISCLLTGVDRYNINATDHAFWLGVNSIDYCIEFRDYGYSVSLDKRGLKKEQLLLLPYYPIFNKSTFLGFPKEISSDNVKIFSGGALYKIYGDNGLYFEIVKKILTDNPNSVLLYAGSGNTKIFNKFIKDNKFQHRVFFLGNRKDIYEVFLNSDIYLATYPISGGLMSQFAALCGKPIMAYTPPNLQVNRLEGTVCHETNIGITHNNLNDLYKYACYLINNKDNRMRDGAELLGAVISSTSFNEELLHIVDTNESKRRFRKEVIDYNFFSDLYLEVENKFEPTFQKMVAYTLKFKTIKYPKIFVNVILIIWKQIFKIN